MKKIQKQYQDVVNQYLKKFIKKHKYEFSYWVCDEIGGIACFIDQYFFNFDDIRFDIDNKVEKELIFRWQDDDVEHNLGILDDNCVEHIDFISYSSGIRYKNLSSINKTI